MFALIAGLFLIIAFGDDGIVWPAAVLGAFSAASSLYRESWKFYIGDNKSLTGSIGLWPIARKRTYNISEIKAVSVETPQRLFTKSLANQAWSSGQERMGNIFDRRAARLVLLSEEGPPIVIYAEPTRKMDKLSELAGELAGFLSLPCTISEQ